MKQRLCFIPELVMFLAVGIGCGSDDSNAPTGASTASGAGGNGGATTSSATTSATGGGSSGASTTSVTSAGGTDGSGGSAGVGGSNVGGSAGLGVGGSGGTGTGGAGGSKSDAGAAGGSTGSDAATIVDAPSDGSMSPSTSFFVTSKGPGMGGNLGGLDGADAFCKQLATAASAQLGAKTWHAYLSTANVNARDRIGAGPWRNVAGKVIANNLTDLHDQLAANAALNATWPIAATNVALDEKGAEVPINPLVHDILTGSNTDGTVATGTTCNDWTSSATTGMAQVGHSNRSGGGRPPSWNAAHTVGCGEPTAGMDFQAGTVSSGGGRGSLYCFALP